jgi:hypothetical protein
MCCTFATPRLLGNHPRLCLLLFVLFRLPELLLLIDDLYTKVLCDGLSFLFLWASIVR